MDLLTTLFYLLFITLPMGAIIRIPIVASAYLYPIDIPVLGIFVISLYKYIRVKNIFKDTLRKSFLFFFGFALLSLLLNSFWLKPLSLLISFLYLFRLFCYMNILFSVQFLSPHFKRRLSLYAVISGVTIVLVGFIQYFYYPALKNLYYLGWDDHLYRMFSTFLDPNFVGAFFVLLVLLQIGLFFQTSWSNAKIIRIITGITIFLTLTAIFLTYSRTAYVMLFVSTISIAFLFAKKKWVIGLFVIILVAYLLIPKNYKLVGLDPFRTASTHLRAVQYVNAFTIFIDSPVFGIGFDAYRFAQERHGMIAEGNDATHNGSGVPNSWLVVLVTTGIIGFILYINFWRNVLQVLFRQKKSYVNSAVIISIIALFVGSLFENLLFYPFIMVWIFLAVGEFVTN